MGHINITNQTFAEVSVLPWLYLFSKTDGVVGLAFHSLSRYNYSCVFENLFLQNRIKKPIFSIYFNRYVKILYMFLIIQSIQFY